MPVYNVELRPGFGGKLARSAGNALYVMGIDKRYASSNAVGEMDSKLALYYGQVSNPESARINLGKAGRSRHLGIRPTVVVRR